MILRSGWENKNEAGFEALFFFGVSFLEILISRGFFHAKVFREEVLFRAEVFPSEVSFTLRFLHAEAYFTRRFVSRGVYFTQSAACGGYAEEQRAQRDCLQHINSYYLTNLIKKKQVSNCNITHCSRGLNHQKNPFKKSFKESISNPFHKSNSKTK